MKSTFSEDEIKNDKERNFAERISFIKYWADYIKKNPDRKWGKGQAQLINSQVFSSRKFYRELSKTRRGREKIKKLKELKLRRVEG